MKGQYSKNRRLRRALEECRLNEWPHDLCLIPSQHINRRGTFVEGWYAAMKYLDDAMKGTEK